MEMPMKLSERLNRDKEMLKTLEGNSKYLFIWDYYKIPILTALCLLVVLVSILVSAAGRKDVALYAVFVNAQTVEQAPDESVINALVQGEGMEGKVVDITADLTLGLEGNEEYDGQTIQILASLFGITGLDVFAANEAVFERYAGQDAFVDLSLFLEPELLEGSGRSPYRYVNGEGKEIVGGVVLQPGSPLHEAGYYYGKVVVGVAANAENMDAAVYFLRQLLRAED